MSNESIAETTERSEIGTPRVPENLIEVIAARRRKIRDDAACQYCGATLAACKAERGKDPTAPAWFGCCAHGLGMEPCSHRASSRALTGLLDEIEAGSVRTVEEMVAAEPPASVAAYLEQGTWWRNRRGEWLPIADMTPGHRYNAAAMSVRNWERLNVRKSALYAALTKGLTVHGDGTSSWQATATDPVTGEPCEAPSLWTSTCEIPACGCSGGAHA